VGGAPLILLDTHVLIWLEQEDAALGRTARQLADDALAAGRLAVSAIAFWETALLTAERRLETDVPVAQWRRDLLSAGLVEVPLDGEIGVTAVQLEGLHPDPADRMIVSTAVVKGATLLTADARILRWPGALRRHDARL
jgi:PIN domain nuclease of toxin-antitoxin system